MNQVVAIAVNTFKETIRDRVLAVIVVFALIIIAGGLWLGSISLGEQGRMMKDFGLVAVTFFELSSPCRSPQAWCTKRWRSGRCSCSSASR